LPKRAFPDESAQNWFRTLANQRASTSAAADAGIVPGQFTTKGITLTVRMEFRDYLIRMVTSWRMRGLALGVLALMTGACLFAPVPPHPVHSQAQTLVFMLAFMVSLMLALAPAVAFVAWVLERKWRTPQHVVLSSEGLNLSAAVRAAFCHGRRINIIWRTAGRFYVAAKRFDLVHVAKTGIRVAIGC